MKVKRIQTGYYVSTDDKYVIKRNDWKEWDIYRDVGRSDNRKEYLITYRLLKDAKKYVESKTKAMDVGNLLKETKMITVTLIIIMKLLQLILINFKQLILE